MAVTIANASDKRAILHAIVRDNRLLPDRQANLPEDGLVKAFLIPAAINSLFAVYFLVALIRTSVACCDSVGLIAGLPTDVMPGSPDAMRLAIVAAAVSVAAVGGGLAFLTHVGRGLVTGRSYGSVHVVRLAAVALVSITSVQIYDVAFATDLPAQLALYLVRGMARFTDLQGPSIRQQRLIWRFAGSFSLCLAASASRRVMVNRLVSIIRSDRATRIVMATLSVGRSPTRYALYLRPFASTRAVRRHVGWLIKLAYVSNNVTDFEGYIHQSITAATGLPVIGLGHEGENVGVGRVRLREEHWQSVTEEMIRHADVIFLMASGKPGTLWETQLLFSRRHLARTVFLAPPQSLYSRRYESADDYAGALFLFNENGKKLPNWTPGGLSFCYGPAGSEPSQTVDLGFGGNQRDCRDALRLLHPVRALMFDGRGGGGFGTPANDNPA